MKPKTAVGALIWGQPVRGLRLGLSAQNSVFHLTLQNVGHTPLTVLSHVDAGEVQLDWYTLRLQNHQGEARTLRFTDAREESSIVQIHLEAGKSIEQEVNARDWAERSINSAKPLIAGTYTVSAVYEVPSSSDHWSGHLEAGPVTQVIPAQENPQVPK